MSDDVSLTIAMAEKCRDMILSHEKAGLELDQPASLQPAHLEWMCKQVAVHSSDWPATRIHRWLGFVQAGMIANQMIDLRAAMDMFDRVKSDYGAPDDDLLDHLDPNSSFRLDIGGQG